MSMRRRSIASSLSTWTHTDPRAASALPPPLNSSVKSSRRGTSSPDMRRRRFSTAAFSVTANATQPLRNPHIATMPETAAPSAPRHSAHAIAKTATRSRVSCQPASSRSRASRRRTKPTGTAALILSCCCLSHVRSGAAGSCAATSTAPEQNAPAPIEATTIHRSGLGQPNAMQARQLQKPAHPRVTGSHHTEHREQERRPRGLVERVEIRRVEGGENQQECDWQRNDDGRRRARLRLQRAGLTLNLLRGRDGRLEVCEQGYP